MNWLSLTGPQVPITKEVSRVVGGVECKVSLSPYDVPQAIRGYEDKEKHWFIIELKYLTEEPIIEKQPDEFTRIEIGRNSNRIYRIKFDLKAIEEQLKKQFPHLVTAAMDAARVAMDPSHERNSRLSDYFDLTKKAVLGNSERFLSDLVKNS
jgi:hypothetical protein